MILNLNSTPNSIFKVNASELADHSNIRAEIVQAGRMLSYEHARKGQSAMYAALERKDATATPIMDGKQYKELNERFRNDHLLYAASKVCEFSGASAPKTFDEFKKQSMNFYGNAHFYAVLQGIYQEIVTPILPRTYSEAVSVFADVVEVGFGETASITVESGDIPVFQDSAWGANRSVPANRFYAKDYTLNPQPKTCEIRAKWMQIVGNNTDWGAFFANITAGLYAKTMGMWSAMMSSAASDTTKIPAGLTYNFSSQNWVTLANKLAAVNNTSIENLIAYGSAVPLSKVLPTQATGSANVNMDAALAALLGRDYIQSGYLGKFMNVRLMPLTDAIVPGTQFSTVSTVLDNSKIWMMASNGRKPVTIAYNSDVPISIEVSPERTASMELIFNLTTAIDSAAVFASHVGLVNI